MELKLLTWNINGINAAINKGLWSKLDFLKPDIFCFNETKANSEKMKKFLSGTTVEDVFGNTTLDIDPFLAQYNVLWNSATSRNGYSGVATFWKKDNLELINSQISLNIEEFDIEGRVVLTDIKLKNSDFEFVLINCYYPQGGRGPHRIAYKLEFYRQILKLTKDLKKIGKKVILCGDFNTTVKDIDLARPKENRKTTGCLPEEREAMDWFIADDFVDSFRLLYPDLEGKYTYWDQITRARERNVGWRIDYFLVDKDLQENIVDCKILDQVMGSDHCPVELTLKI